nr:TOBE domain-containing protein [uncultured Holophaga sp.]
MKISARNVLKGQVTEVTKGAVNTLVALTLPGGVTIYATITNASAEALALTKGREASAIIKASAVLVGKDLAGAQLSAKNQLVGRICKVVDGPVSAEVDIEVASGVLLSAVITHESAKSLAFKVGDQASAIFKASSVMLGVE